VNTAGALEAVERILNRGGDSDAVIAAVLEALRARGVPAVLHPGANGAPGALQAPIAREGRTVATLELGAGDRAFAERVALLLSPYVR
jgi:hypothetical protein